LKTEQEPRKSECAGEFAESESGKQMSRTNKILD